MARKRKRSQDPKEEALEAYGALNPRAGELRDEQFSRGGFFDPRDLVQVKYEMLRRNLSDGWSATATAQAYGFSRATFYATKDAFDREGLLGLLPKKPGPRGPHKLTGEVLEFVERLLAKKPDLDSQGLVEEIQAKFDLRVHRRSVERALARSSASGKKKSS